MPALAVEQMSLFLLVLARTGAWVVSAPVLSARGMPGVGRLAAAVALALFVTPSLAARQVPDGLGRYVVAALGQVAVGLALGLLTQLLFLAFEVAGGWIDTAGGFAAASILDPLSGQPAAAFSRLFSLVFGALFFVTDTYAKVIGGLVGSFRAWPLDALPSLSDGAGPALGTAVTQVLANALQIGAPLLGVLFLTDVALGVAARFVPQANTLSLALPVKSLVALAAAGAALSLLPAQLGGLVEPAVQLPFQVLR